MDTVVRLERLIRGLCKAEQRIVSRPEALMEIRFIKSSLRESATWLREHREAICREQDLRAKAVIEVSAALGIKAGERRRPVPFHRLYSRRNER